MLRDSQKRLGLRKLGRGIHQHGRAWPAEQTEISSRARIRCKGDKFRIGKPVCRQKIGEPALVFHRLPLASSATSIDCSRASQPLNLARRALSPEIAKEIRRAFSGSIGPSRSGHSTKTISLSASAKPSSANSSGPERRQRSK